MLAHVLGARTRCLQLAAVEILFFIRPPYHHTPKHQAAHAVLVKPLQIYADIYFTKLNDSNSKVVIFKSITY